MTKFQQNFFKGSVMPLFGIIFGDTLGVLGDEDPDEARANTIKYAMMFVGLGFYAFFTQFIQVGRIETKDVQFIHYKYITGSDVFYLWGESHQQDEEGRLPSDVTTRNGLVRSEGEQHWSSVCQVGL